MCPEQTRISQFLIAVLFLTATVFNAGAEEIDAENARIRLAVPDVLVVDNLSIDGEPYIVTIAADEVGNWRITAVEPQAESRIPSTVVLDLARLAYDENGTLEIKDIYLDGQFYSGSIDFSDDLEAVNQFSFTPAEAPTTAENALLAEMFAIYSRQVEPDPIVVLEEPLSPELPPQAEEPPLETDLREPQPERLEPADEDPYAEAIAQIDRRIDRIEHTVDAIAVEGAARAARIEEAIRALEGGDTAALDVRLAAIEQATQTLLDRSERLIVPAPATTVEPEPQVELVPASERPPTELGRREDAETLAPTIGLAWARANFAGSVGVDLTDTGSLRGSWDVTTSSARQVDRNELFAKLELPLVQDGRPRLYRMLTRSLDPEWVGVGLHLTVDGVQLPTGYGHGRSLLVWLTRDPATYGNDDTYLEVYRSFDDINMDRIAQAHIPTSLADRHALEILIDPGAGYITLAVNGVEHLRYRLEDPIEAGFSLALRSLGRAEFAQLEYRTVRP